jgi:hypothetical protein
MADQPQSLLERWREQNRTRDGAPSQLLKQMRADAEGLRKWAETPRIRDLRESLRRMQASQVTGRLMGRSRPASAKRDGDANIAKKQKRGAGRKPSLKSEQITEGQRLLRSRPRMKVLAACQTLLEAGIKTNSSSLYRLIIKPAYASR